MLCNGSKYLGLLPVYVCQDLWPLCWPSVHLWWTPSQLFYLADKCYHSLWQSQTSSLLSLVVMGSPKRHYMFYSHHWWEATFSIKKNEKIYVYLYINYTTYCNISLMQLSFTCPIVKKQDIIDKAHSLVNICDLYMCVFICYFKINILCVINLRHDKILWK